MTKKEYDNMPDKFSLFTKILLAKIVAIIGVLIYVIVTFNKVKNG